MFIQAWGIAGKAPESKVDMAERLNRNPLCGKGENPDA